MRNAYPGARWEKRLQTIIDTLGPIPHDPLNFAVRSEERKGEPEVTGRRKPQKGRMHGASCPECGYKIFLTKMWSDDPEYGPPVCPKHGKRMAMDPPKNNPKEEAAQLDIEDVIQQAAE